MMDDFLQFLREPIAQRSLLACVMIGFANGFVSGLVILKKSALQIGTLSCALLPGIAVAVLLFGLTRWSLLTGAVVAALLVGKAYRAAELDIRFTLTPASTLHGDNPYLPAMGMITVLGNLIENAFDALLGAPPGEASEVTVSIREGQHGLVISVDDTGPGMTEEVRAHIFDKGFSTKVDSRGTGLSLVQDTLAAYGGTIRVESEPGVGTSFIITLDDQP